MILKTKSKGIAHDTFANIFVNDIEIIQPSLHALRSGQEDHIRTDGWTEGWIVLIQNIPPHFVVVGMIIKSDFAKDKQYGDIVYGMGYLQWTYCKQLSCSNGNQIYTWITWILLPYCGRSSGQAGVDSIIMGLWPYYAGIWGIRHWISVLKLPQMINNPPAVVITKM